MDWMVSMDSKQRHRVWCEPVSDRALETSAAFTEDTESFVRLIKLPVEATALDEIM
jgi:hypothetical protein